MIVMLLLEWKYPALKFDENYELDLTFFILKQVVYKKVYLAAQRATKVQEMLKCLNCDLSVHKMLCLLCELPPAAQRPFHMRWDIPPHWDIPLR